jgi:hypothetical protein
MRRSGTSFPGARTATRSTLAAALFLAAALVLSATPANADATGTFTSGRRTLDLDGTYAFWSKSAGPSHEEVIKVAVSNAEFGEGFFDDYYDREHAIDVIFVDDQAKVVFLEFDATGKYHGLSYFFAPGENCGWCYDSSVKSSVSVASGRLAGKLTFHQPGTRLAFDVTLTDVAVPQPGHGTALPADGGAPARAYLAYHRALNASDAKAVYAALVAKRRANWDKWKAQGQDVMGRQWEDLHGRMSDVTVTGGFQHGNRAVVLFDGRSKLVDRLHGEALLRQESGEWRLQDELVSVGARTP